MFNLSLIMYVGPTHFNLCVRIDDCCDPVDYVLLDKFIKIC